MEEAGLGLTEEAGAGWKASASAFSFRICEMERYQGIDAQTGRSRKCCQCVGSH